MSLQNIGHVAFLAFPFASHPLPLFNLTCKLARAAPDVQFSFFTTSKSNKSISSSSSATEKNIDFLPNLKVYEVEDGIPEGYDLSNDRLKEPTFFFDVVPKTFKKGMDAAVADTGRRITLVVADAFISFGAGKLAEEMKVPLVLFWISAPYSIAVYVYRELIHQRYTDAINHGQTAEDQILDDIPGMSALRFSDLSIEMLLPRERLPPDLHVFSSNISEKVGAMCLQAAAVVLNSFEEINPALLSSDLKSKFNKLLYLGPLSLPVIPLDPLPPSADATGCLSWLDGQKAESVVYIAMGTIVKLSGEELAALAEALDDSGFPFLWSLEDESKALLPDGFVERTSKIGKVVPWTPQTQVLAHGAVGVHVTHCGYNSVCESIVAGVPLICRPIWSENHLNARMVEDVWRIGVSVEGGVVTKSGMIKSLETIFHHERGRKMREAVMELKETAVRAAAPDGSAARDLQTLVEIVSKV